MALQPVEPDGPDTPPQPELDHRKRLSTMVTADAAGSPLAWALAELAGLSEWVEQSRGAWTAARFRPSPEPDAAAALLWAAWMAADPWSGLAVWNEHFRSHARRAVLSVLRARGVSPDAWGRILDEFDEQVFLQLSNHRREPPGWAALAARVLETADAGPLASMVDSSPVAEVAAQCVATRGGRAGSLQTLEPDLLMSGLRGRRLVEMGRPGPVADAFLDAHLVLRLLAQWHRGRCTAWSGGRNVAAQGWTKGRSRLRAAAARDPQRLAEQVLAMDGLHARTVAALQRLCGSWALDEYPDFAFGADRPLSPRCELDETPPLPFDATEQAVVRSWLVLVVLRGRAARLRRWTELGGTGDKDKTWGRLQEQVPDRLCDPGAVGRSRGYSRLRAHLLEGLDEELAAVGPLLDRVAALLPELDTRAGSRALPGRLRTMLSEDWVDSSTWGADPSAARPSLPKSGYPTAVRAAAAFVRAGS